MTNNKHVLSWIEEMAAMTQPDKIVWIDGSDEQAEALRAEGDLGPAGYHSEELPASQRLGGRPGVLPGQPGDFQGVWRKQLLCRRRPSHGLGLLCHRQSF